MRPYDPASDEPAVLALWDTCLGDCWPLDAAALRREVREGLVLEQGGASVGFAAFEADGDRGGLVALLVHPEHRRLGVGRKLHDAALATMRGRGVTTVRLAVGPSGYLWPGVPLDLPDAWAFFAALGWESTETAADLVLDLADYATPAWVWERLAPGVSIAPATAEDAAAVYEFERTYLSGWEQHFAKPFATGEPADVLVACAADGTILGTIQLLDPRSRWYGQLTWSRRLGELTGGPAAVGVAEHAREQGIGLALVARATEQLKERGLTRSCVIWTWLRDWYGKLGYRVWAEYRVSRRSL